MVSCHQASNIEEKPEISDYTVDALLWADSVSLAMKPRDLASQMVMPAIYADSLQIRDVIANIGHENMMFGGIMFLHGDIKSAKIIADTLSALSKIGMFVAIDAEWGLNMRFPEAPAFPLNGLIAHTVDDQLMYDYGYELAQEANSVGINMVLGPVLDVAAPLTPIGRRSYGINPKRVSSLGIAYARGLEDGNAISVAKHFPGLGSANIDTHRGQPIVTATREHLDSVDLYPFYQYIEAGLSAIMIGHAAFTALDTIVRSATVSPMIMRELLREQLGFNGLIITDAMNMNGLGKVEHPAAAAIIAGADIVLAPGGSLNAVNEILTAMSDGSLPIEEVRERVSRILFFKYRLGLASKHPSLRRLMPLHTHNASSIAKKLQNGL